MDTLRWVGAGIVVSGAVLVLSVQTTLVNPNLSVANLGFPTILLGIIVLASSVYRKRVRISGQSLYLSIGGWLMMSGGLLVGLYGFMLASQVACFCPLNSPCSCGVPLYNLMMSAGTLSAVTGGTFVTASRFVNRSGPVQIQTRRTTRLGPRGIAAVGVFTTAVVVFALFSYYPGVYITSINEATQFPPGALENLSPGAFPITSPIEEPQGGFQIPVGGTFNYILQFKSLSSFPNYTINEISMGYGFSIAGMNASLPIRISPTDPSVSVAFTLRGPFYPYYGPVSFQIGITK